MNDDAALSRLLAVVHRARRRWFARRTVLYLTCVAAGISALAAIASGLLAVEAFALGVRSVWVIVATLGILGAAAAVAVARWQTPSEGAMVRYADDHYGLASRFVTARDLAARPPREGAARTLWAALRADLSRHAPRMRASELVPFHFRVVHGAAVAVVATSVVLAGTVGTWVSPAVDVPPDRPETVEDWDEGQRGALAAELEGLADALDAEAEEAGEAYTQALAEGSRDLARRLRESGGDLSASEAAAEVDRLLSHVEDALGSRFAANGGLQAQPDAQGAQAQDEGAVGGEEGPPITDLEIPSADGGMGDALSDVQSVRESLQMAQSRRSDNPYGGSFEVRRRGSAADVQEAGMVGEAPQEDAAGAPAGAARRSTDAAGDAAGGGSQDLNVGERAEAAGFDPTEDVTLPKAAITDGARVRASGESPPEGEASVIARGPAEGASAAAEGEGARVASRDSIRRDAGGWRREALDPNARLLARRLFRPETTE